MRGYLHLKRTHDNEIFTLRSCMDCYLRTDTGYARCWSVRLAFRTDNLAGLVRYYLQRLVAEMNDIEQLQELANEPLCPELAAHRQPGPLGYMVTHPLVHAVTAMVPGMLNRQLEYKRKQLARHAKAGDWDSWVFTYERPYRVSALINLIDRDLIPPDHVGPIMANIWTDTENIHQHIEDWSRLFREYAHDGQMMSSNERDKLANMPDRLTVYRGECNDGGWSWSLSKDVAVFFARRPTHDGTGEVTSGYVDKRHVIAYLDRRSEEEIIVDDRVHVTNQLTQRI